VLARFIAVALTAVLCSQTAAARAPASPARGRALFTGGEPLTGRVRDHGANLPPAVVVCQGCHRTGSAGETTPRPAPDLERGLLLQARVRRGGPPSAYNRAAFCKLLRTGIDPAYVLVAREMPIFELDDAQCESLWQFLVADGGTR